MLIYKYCLKNVVVSVLAVLGVLSVVFVGNQFVRLLGAAASGKFPIDVVWDIMLYSLPHFIALLMPLSVFLGILMTYSKLYAEQEASTMVACGVAPSYFVRVALAAAMVFSSVAAICSLYWSPAGLTKVEDIKAQMRANAKLETLSPGRFHEFSGGKRILFIEDGSPKEKKIEDFFMISNLGMPGEQVITARRGEFNLSQTEQSNYLALKNGYRYVGTNTEDINSIQGFHEFGIRLFKQDAIYGRQKISAIDTLSLINSDDPKHVAEWQWRFSVPLSILVLSFIAVPLGHVKPRQGRFAKFFPGILLYFGYFVLMTSSRSMVEDGAVLSFLGLWWVHLMLFIIGLAMYLANVGTFKYLSAKKRPVVCMD